MVNADLNLPSLKMNVGGLVTYVFNLRPYSYSFALRVEKVLKGLVVGCWRFDWGFVVLGY